jgi:hypothetical protein
MVIRASCSGALSQRKYMFFHENKVNVYKAPCFTNPLFWNRFISKYSANIKPKERARIHGKSSYLTFNFPMKL